MAAAALGLDEERLGQIANGLGLAVFASILGYHVAAAFARREAS